jgi:hypothetical protein
MTSATDNQRAAGELAGFAQVKPRRYPRAHRLAPQRPEPCTSYRWCHRASTAAAAVLNPERRDRYQPKVIETVGRVALIGWWD